MTVHRHPPALHSIQTIQNIEIIGVLLTVPLRARTVAAGGVRQVRRAARPCGRRGAADGEREA